MRKGREKRKRGSKKMKRYVVSSLLEQPDIVVSIGNDSPAKTEQGVID